LRIGVADGTARPVALRFDLRVALRGSGIEGPQAAGKVLLKHGGVAAAACNARWRCPEGMSASPASISAMVMALVYRPAGVWRSIQASTAASG